MDKEQLKHKLLVAVEKDPGLFADDLAEKLGVDLEDVLFAMTEMLEEGQLEFDEGEENND